MILTLRKSILMLTFLSSWQHMGYGIIGNQSGRLISEELAAKVEQSVQQYCYDSYELFRRASKGDEARFLSSSNAKVIERAQELFKEIDTIRSTFFNQADHVKAVTLFSNHLARICNEFGLRRYYIFSFPEKVYESTPIENQLKTITQALAVIGHYYDSIRPMPPLTTRLANALFYNFFTTKVAPRMVEVSGTIGSGLWGTRMAANWFKNDKSISFLKYKEIQHNQNITRQQDASDRFIRAFDTRMNNNPLANLFAQFMSQTNTANPPAPAQMNFNPCNENDPNNSGWRSIFHKCSHTECRATHKGHPSDKSCLYCEGINFNPFSVGGHLGYMARFLIPYYGAKHLGKIIEDAQLPEYERRIKTKEKEEEERRIENEKKNLKINRETTISFAKVKGQKEVISEELAMLVDYLKHPFKYKNTSSGTRSVLLYGPPGNGKTLLARAIAKESGAPFLEVTADDIMNVNSKDKILATWRMAEEVAASRPEKSVIIYIDEIDTVVGNRHKNENLDPERAKALSNLLSIFDGIEKRNPYIHIVIILTTNHYENLDPALLRPGRIDRKILIGKPSETGRREFLEWLLPKDRWYLMDELIENTKDFSGAQIVNVIDTANMLAAYENYNRPTDDHYRRAIKRLAHEDSQMPDSAKR